MTCFAEADPFGAARRVAPPPLLLGQRGVPCFRLPRPYLDAPLGRDGKLRLEYNVGPTSCKQWGQVLRDRSRVGDPRNGCADRMPALGAHAPTARHTGTPMCCTVVLP